MYLLKNKQILTLVLLISIFTLGGCSPDPVQNELIDYINNEVPKFGPLETEMVKAYDDVSGDNYKNDAIMFKALDEVVVPKCTKILSIIEHDVSPKTKEIQSLHNIYIDAYQELLKGYTLTKKAISESDGDFIKQANKNFELGRSLQQQWLTRINELKKKHNVILE